MQYKTISDTATGQAFSYTFNDSNGIPAHEQAQRVSTAIIGWFVGTYKVPHVELTIRGEGKGKAILEVNYVADRDLTAILNRIAQTFEPVAHQD